MPKRAMSKRLAAVAMYSMAQHAVPNGMGHSELLRAQLVRKSSRVVTQLGEIDETVVESLSRYSVAGLVNPIGALPASRYTRTPPRESR